jgi:hypothetical protein
MIFIELEYPVPMLQRCCRDVVHSFMISESC